MNPVQAPIHRPSASLRRKRALLFGALLTTLGLGGCSDDPETSQLDHIQAQGELVVATRNAATTYYEGPLGATGPEYILARQFADDLGVELRLSIHTNPAEIFAALESGEVHMAAAALTHTREREAYLDFGPAYQYTATLVVNALGRGTHPGDIAALEGRDIAVIAGSSHADRLRDLKRSGYPDLVWQERDDVEVEDLLAAVRAGDIDHTLVDANEFQLARRFFPELRTTLDLTGPQPIAWAFAPGDDASLRTAAEDFFSRAKSDGFLAQVLDHHYSHLHEFDYVGTRAFMRHMNTRLREYEDLFIEAGRHNDLDWRLLAATGYQESHWNPRAVSPTGVRGIMMLTQPTAQFMGVSRRTDPVQSIRGGSAYLRNLKDRLPESVEDPDRTWMALAAYNVGLGHLRDARDLTEAHGGNPDLWIDVREYLPLLRQRAWYSQTRHGYARGDEAVHYVENIRSYYDILLRTRNPDGSPTTLAQAS